MPQRAVFLRRMIIKRNMIDTKFGGPKNQQILCSSDYNTPKMFEQYYRHGCCPEDPWLSYKHHGTSSMMYRENGMFGYNILLLLEANLHTGALFCTGSNGHLENVQKNGMNVWIYPPPSSKPAGQACNVRDVVPSPVASRHTYTYLHGRTTNCSGGI